MQLRPRHYILIALLIALTAYNLLRLRHGRTNSNLAPTNVTTTAALPPGTSPVWAVYEKAAGDAIAAVSDVSFQADLQTLNDALSNASAQSAAASTPHAELDDLTGCRTWLLFYRAERTHPTNKPDWLPQTHDHVLSCVANHRDIAH